MIKKQFYLGSLIAVLVLGICACAMQILVADCHPELVSGSSHTQYKAIFAHGLGGDKRHGQYYGPLMGYSIIGENGPEWDRNKYGKDAGPSQSCLAQQGDIDVVVKQIKENLSENLILFGVSKGAATVLNTVGYLAENNPEYLKNIKMVIADCPFATPERVAARMVSAPVEMLCGEFCGDCVGSTVDSSLGQWVVKKTEKAMYKNYDPNGITPIKAITQMWSLPTVDRNMVIVLIHSKPDELISINDSRWIYIELKKLGYKNVYLIEAEHGGHRQACFYEPDYGFAHPVIKPEILASMCSICVKHNLPPPKLAVTGCERKV